MRISKKSLQQHKPEDELKFLSWTDEVEEKEDIQQKKEFSWVPEPWMIPRKVSMEET